MGDVLHKWFTDDAVSPFQTNTFAVNLKAEVDSGTTASTLRILFPLENGLGEHYRRPGSSIAARLIFAFRHTCNA